MTSLGKALRVVALLGVVVFGMVTPAVAVVCTIPPNCTCSCQTTKTGCFCFCANC